MATDKTLALRHPAPPEPCVRRDGTVGRKRPEGYNHAPFHYLDGNREARRHRNLHPQVWAHKIEQYMRGEL